MLTREEMDDIRRRHRAKEVLYHPDGEVAGVVVFDADAQSSTAKVDVSVENEPNRDDDVHRLLETVEEMQGMLKRMVEVAEAVGPNEYGVFPLIIDTSVLGRLKEMAGHESED
jgi:quinolinate synthase